MPVNSAILLVTQEWQASSGGAKIVEYLKAAGSEDNASILIKAFNETFEFSNWWSGREEMHFVGTETVQAWRLHYLHRCQ